METCFFSFAPIRCSGSSSFWRYITEQNYTHEILFVERKFNKLLVRKKRRRISGEKELNKTPTVHETFHKTFHSFASRIVCWNSFFQKKGKNL